MLSGQSVVESSQTDDLPVIVRSVVDPLILHLQETAQRLPKQDAAVYLLNNLTPLRSTLSLYQVWMLLFTYFLICLDTRKLNRYNYYLLVLLYLITYWFIMKFTTIETKYWIFWIYCHFEGLNHFLVRRVICILFC